MKTTLILLFQLMALSLLAGEVNGVAAYDSEYAYKTMDTGHGEEGDTLLATAPVATYAPCSKWEVMYVSWSFHLNPGDLITGVSFKGYNPGSEQKRHLSVWIMNDRADLTGIFTPTGMMKKVYDGICTIQQGGSPSEPSCILDIPFNEPLGYERLSNIRLHIECMDGEPGDSVFFLHTRGLGRRSDYATDEGGADLDKPVRTGQPVATFTVATPVKYVSGTVADENGDGVAGATVTLTSNDGEQSAYEAATDAEGRYSVRIEEGNKLYKARVFAPGHTLYQDDAENRPVLDNPVWNYTIYGSVTYPANKRSTIILPVAPDATVGRYYRLDRKEGNRIVFVREPMPQANIPYVLFAERDYVVSLEGMDLTVQPGRVDIEEVSFVGSYLNSASYYVTLENTPLCLDDVSETGWAMHAWLWMYWMLSDNHELVFEEQVSGIQTAAAPGPAPSLLVLHDLQGRRLQTPPRKGVYISEGKKSVR